MVAQQQVDWQIFDDAGQRKYVSQSERERFLEAADGEAPNVRVLCYLVAYTGCRISEAVTTQFFHVDEDRNTVTFRTLKRRKAHWRYVPIPSFLTEMILDLREPGQTMVWAIHRATAWRWIKRVMVIAKVAGPMATCKGLRHGFGIWAAMQSIPPNLIQRWMGHASSTTTAIYLDVIGAEERMFAERLWEQRTMDTDSQIDDIQYSG